MNTYYSEEPSPTLQNIEQHLDVIAAQLIIMNKLTAAMYLINKGDPTGYKFMNDYMEGK